MDKKELTQITEALWEIPKTGNMQVPARIYATESMLPSILSDNAPNQAVNVAHLPGIVNYSLAMPDIHWGYGFPIGGVAAFDVNNGVISPGGVGYDINCGVRLFTCKLNRQQIGNNLRKLVQTLFDTVPTGVGKGGKIKLSANELRKVMTEGAGWAIKNGHGTGIDLDFIEENGCVDGCEPDFVSKRAFERGKNQIGTLGSGNHFLEIGYVAQIYDEKAAAVLGLEKDQITGIIHCGSRGFGHQICEDNLLAMDAAVKKYGIHLPDRQLACTPINSPEGQKYLGAMRCAINFAFANRQVIYGDTVRAFCNALNISASELGMRVVYEVAHNIAKFERHLVNGKTQKVCVHRKGATRAFSASREEIPAKYRTVGQPVLIPGDMGRYSYVLVGTEKAMQETFGSTCHGAGRAMSRTKAKKSARNRNIGNELAMQGIHVIGASSRTLDEEIPEAYKDVSDVVNACEIAGISKKVAQLKPLGCIKG